MIPEWHEDFWAFAKGVGDRPERHQLRRIDHSRPLGPDNAQWSPYKVEQTVKGEAAGNHAVYMRAYLRQRRALDPLHDKRSALPRAHGITLDDFERMLAHQGGVCAICGRPESRLNTYAGGGQTFSLAVDHQHEPPKIRGLLCTPCNQALGQLDDSPTLLQRAIDYLANPPATTLGLVHSGKHVRKRRPREPSPYVKEA